ncbi:MAG: hypothetical protein ACRCZ0_12045 [Cetobacterium sp.]
MISIIITGEVGVGKDFVMKEISKKYKLHKCVTDTTRPIREGEVDGVDYNFKSCAEFEESLALGEYLETQRYPTVYGDWYYGSKLSEVKPNSMIILDLEGAQTYMKLVPNALHIHLVAWDDTERFYRSLKRLGDTCSYKDVEEVYRRIRKDEHKFKDVEPKDNTYIVPQFYNQTTTDAIFNILDLFVVDKLGEEV